MRASLVVLVVTILVQAASLGCGTYSMVRPANTLPAGKVELAGGLAASNLGEVNTIVHAAVGITDRIEILGQNEIWNSFVEGRFGILHQREPRRQLGPGATGAPPKQPPVALAVGLGVGQAVTLLSALTESGDNDSVDGAAATASIAVGRDFGAIEGTLGVRTIWLSGGYLATSTRLAARITATDHLGFFVEAGATAHTPLAAPGAALVISEASAGFWFGF